MATSAGATVVTIVHRLVYYLAAVGTRSCMYATCVSRAAVCEVHACTQLVPLACKRVLAQANNLTIILQGLVKHCAGGGSFSTSAKVVLEVANETQCSYYPCIRSDFLDYRVNYTVSCPAGKVSQ